MRQQCVNLAGRQLDAIEAGRQLMIDKASWLAADTTLEVAIYSALEWRPEKED